MPYIVSGRLKLPNGQAAAGVDISFTALKTYTPLIETAQSAIRTGQDGTYSITLEYNTYNVDVTYANNKPFRAGQIFVAADTTAGQDLQSLLTKGSWVPATPEWMRQIEQWLVEARQLNEQAIASAASAKDSATSAQNSEVQVKADRAEVASAKTVVLAAQSDVTAKSLQATASASSAASSRDSASASASIATQKAAAAAASEASASASATRAENAANIAAGALIDAGQYNASTGVLPTPVMSGSTKLSSIWKVTANGVAGGIDLGIGDSLVYTSSDNSYYKIDNTESVSKVNNKTGVVVLTAADVGADPAGTALSARLPTPDVSIPFCEDLEMDSGLGYDTMQIGADTLSIPGANLVSYQRLGSQTMLDKSGRLVTVGINLPAIEQQGLAIYDQSVNLAAPSINWVGALTAAPWAHSAKDEFGWITVSGSGDPSASEGSRIDFTIPSDGTYTFSIDIRKSAGLNSRLRTFGAASGTSVDVAITNDSVTGAGAVDAYDMGSYWRIEMTRSFSGAAKLFRMHPFGADIGAAGGMSYRRTQLEAKPFATPYIENETSAQTARPATTRCDIPWRGNMQPISDNQQITIAMEFDTAGIPQAGASHTLYAHGAGAGQNFIGRVEAGGALRFYRSAGATHQSLISSRRRYRICFRVNRNACDLFVDGVKSGSVVTAVPVSSGLNDVLRLGYSLTAGRCLNGHLRKIDIWNASLPDIQCQAASSQ